MDEVLGMRERRGALAAARAALTRIGDVVWQVPGPDLGPVLREVDDLGALVEAARVAVVGEAMARGEMRSYTGPTPEGGEPMERGCTPDALDTPDTVDTPDVVSAGLAGVPWIREWAPTLRAGGSVQLMRLAERLRSSDHGQLRDAVLSARVGVSNASVCVKEMNRLTTAKAYRPRPDTGWAALGSRALPNQCCRWAHRLRGTPQRSSMTMSRA